MTSTEQASTQATRENKIITLLNGKQFQEASKLSETLTSTHPLRLLSNGLMALHVNQDFEEACINLRRVHKQIPKDLFVIASLAEALKRSGKRSKAIELIRTGLTLYPQNPDLEVKLAFALHENNQQKQAVEVLERSKNGATSSHLGALAFLKFNSGMFSEAKELYQRLTIMNPADHEAFFNLGTSYLRLKDHKRAEISLKESERLGCKRTAELLSYLGIALEEQNKPDEAAKYLIQSINHAGAREVPDAVYHLSLIYLRTGKLRDGFDLYDARFARSGKREHNPPKNLPWWDGKTKSGSLLLWSEQGLGDQILYTSTFYWLCDYFQGSIDCVIERRLVDIFAPKFPRINFVEKINGSAERYDFHLPTGSIPKILLKEEDSANWLLPEKTANDTWPRKTIADKSLSLPLTIGISWFSSNSELPGKNIQPEVLAEILNCIDRPVELINLQYDTNPKDLAILSDLTSQEIKRAESDNKRDIKGLLEVIEDIDLVISISNTTIHLASIVGTPTIMLASKYSGRLWYWEHIDNHANSRWYPNVKVITQTKEGDWLSTLPKIEELLND